MLVCVLCFGFVPAGFVCVRSGLLRLCFLSLRLRVLCVLFLWLSASVLCVLVG